MNPDAVLKIGGSLGRGFGLESLCREISELSKRYRLLIVPGGGQFADHVRDVYRRFRLDETAAHHMALLAMDQYGLLLSALVAGCSFTSDLVGALQSAEAGRAAILLPSALVLQEDPLPHSWQVTSDTISAWIAHRSDCRQLILLKDVEGLYKSGPAEDPSVPIPEMTADQLARQEGGVDAYLSRFLTDVRIETWVISGQHPGRLSELLGSGQTAGTRIRCS